MINIATSVLLRGSVKTRVKHQVLNAIATSIPNLKLNVIIDNKIRVTYDCAIKIT